MKKALGLSVIVIGFTAMVSQIVFMRELLVVFCGNELSIGLILASWLVGGALGSGLLGRFSDRVKYKVNLFLLCQLALSILLPLNIAGIRLIRTLLGVNPGQIIPLSPTIISSLVVLLPVCIILGFIFTLACRIYDTVSASGAIGIGRIYMFEAIGSMAGGLLASFILIRVLSPIDIMVWLSILNIIASLIMPLAFREVRLRVFFLFISNFLLMIFILMWPLKVWSLLDKYSINKEWKGYELVASRNSIYGNITITKRENEYSFFDNGLHLYSVPDRQVAEESVHFALLEQPNPEEVLLIGGGIGGMVEEILKEPVKRVYYIELDPLIITMAEDNLPREYFEPLRDKRVSIVNSDGRFFVKNASKKYDCVIIHIGDPQTAQTNRFYTVEFFKELKRIMKDGGIVSVAVTSSEDYINKQLALFLRSIDLTLNAVFPEVTVIPGNTLYFLASTKKGTLTCDYRVLMDRARARKVDLEYVREYYLASRLSPQRLDYIDNVLHRGHEIKVNHDFRPIAYYYAIIFWASYFKDSLFKGLLASVTEPKLWASVALICFSIFLFTIFNLRHRERALRRIVLLAVAVSGFSMIVFQVVMLVVFQMIYGYLFYKLGIILTSFMIGLTLGALFYIWIMPPLKRDKLALTIAQGAIAIYSLLLPFIFMWLNGLKGGLISHIGADMIFPFLPVAIGFLGGFQFLLANKICLKAGKGIGRSAGLIYGTDLAGSCAGAFMAGTFLIPVFGVPKTCLALSLLNLSVMLVLVILSSGKGADES